MSLWGAFSNSTNAMMAHSTGISIISQNVANVNTTGYKRVEGEFKTMLSESSANFDGFSVRVSPRNIVDSGGPMVSSGRPYDVGIGGDGFFVVNTSMDGSGETLYTRAGSFSSRENNGQAIMTTSEGHPVMGWAIADDGSVPGGEPTSMISLHDDGILEGKATTAVTVRGNVLSSATETEVQHVPLYDNAHTAKSLSLQWTQTSPDVWDLTYSVEDGTVTQPATGTTVTFDGLAQMTSADTVGLGIQWDDGTSSAVTLDIGGITQFAGRTQVASFEQDGYSNGQFDRSFIDDSGKLHWSYDNGHTVAKYQIPVASFVAPNNLEARSGTLWSWTGSTGTPDFSAGDVSYDVPGDNGTGSLLVGAYESSNVDLADEFTKMMMTQKAYSSAATTFRTVDEMIQAAAALKR